MVPIEQHSLLSDSRTAAIATPDARVVWLCAPRVDSRPFLAELLGGPSAGFFAVRPAAPAGRPVQRYAGCPGGVAVRAPGRLPPVPGGAARRSLRRFLRGSPGRSCGQACPALRRPLDGAGDLVGRHVRHRLPRLLGGSAHRRRWRGGSAPRARRTQPPDPGGGRQPTSGGRVRRPASAGRLARCWNRRTTTWSCPPA